MTGKESETSSNSGRPLFVLLKTLLFRSNLPGKRRHTQRTVNLQNGKRSARQVKADLNLFCSLFLKGVPKKESCHDSKRCHRCSSPARDSVSITTSSQKELRAARLGHLSSTITHELCKVRWARNSYNLFWSHLVNFGRFLQILASPKSRTINVISNLYRARCMWRGPTVSFTISRHRRNNIRILSRNQPISLIT